MKLAFVGGGIMGEAMIAGAVANNLAAPADVSVCDIVRERRDHLATTYSVGVTDSIRDAVDGADLAILAVKPQEFPAAAKLLKGHLDGRQTVMSIMAGVRMASISEALAHDGVARAIPNTPAQIGAGMTVWVASASVSEAGRDSVRALLGVLGKEVCVEAEKYIDMATAVSGSGPAYVFLVMEAMIDAAVQIGLRRELAEPMVKQTILGSAKYADASGRHPAELRNQVTSPGGTTAAGLLELEDAALRSAFMHAIEAAYERAQELGE